MKHLAYDIEGTGLYCHYGADMFAYSTCDEEGETEVVRMDGSALRRGRAFRSLKDLWAADRSPTSFILHNAKFDLAFTEKALGGRLDGAIVHDTHKMSHILQNSHPGHGLKELSWELAAYPRGDERKVKEFLKGGARTWQQVPERIMTPYQRGDAERTQLLFQFMWPKIQADPALLEEYRVEMELVWATLRMEERGIKLNTQAAEDMIFDLDSKVDRLKGQLYDIAGGRINHRSDDQLRKVLYQKLKMPVLKYTKKSRKPSVDKFVLMDLRERFPKQPVIDLILQIRSYTKGMSTLEDYIDLAARHDIIHPTINTCAAVTSRESVSHPALQCIPKSEVLLNPFPIPMRKVFQPRPGYIVIFIDYAGIEARLLVHYSEEPEMLKCLNEGDGDLHVLAAETFYENFWKEVERRRKVLRAAAKNANFAAPYGASNKKMKATLGIKSDGPINRYRRRFPLYTGLQKIVAQWVRDEGFVKTAFGRILYVPKNKAYMGTNYLIQGTAAGILKRAQNRVHEYNEWATSSEVKILLPIHDEIVIEYPRNRLSELDGYMRDVSALMTDFPEFKVPMAVEADYSTTSWEDKIPLEIPLC